MINFGNSVPGVRSDRTYTPRVVLWGNSEKTAQYLPGGKVLDGSKSRDPLNTGDVVTLRPGVLVGKITSGGKYAPSVIGTNSSAFSSGTTLATSAATATEISRRIGSSGTFKLVGPPSAAGTVAVTTITFSAVNTTTGDITITDPSVAKVTGSLIMPTDGSETPKGILDQFIRVTDVDDNNLDCNLAKLLVSGFVDETLIVNYPADASTRSWLMAALNGPQGGCGPFLFKGNF